MATETVAATLAAQPPELCWSQPMMTAVAAASQEPCLLEQKLAVAAAVLLSLGKAVALAVAVAHLTLEAKWRSQQLAVAC